MCPLGRGGYTIIRAGSPCIANQWSMAGKGTVKNHDRKAAINFNIFRKYRSKTVARKYRSKHLPGAESARSPRTPRSEDSAQSATDCRRRGSAAQAATGPSCQSAQSIMMARAEPPRAARPPESARAAARRLPMTLCKRHSQTVCGPVTSSRQTSRLHCNTATLRRLQASSRRRVYGVSAPCHAAIVRTHSD